MTTDELREQLSVIDEFSVSPSIEMAITYGERMFTWVQQENAKRLSPLQLAAPLEAVSVEDSLHKVFRYSEKSVGIRLEKFLQEVPAEMRDVLMGNTNPPSELPVDEETFLRFAQEMNDIYKFAARVKLNTPAIPRLKLSAAKDVRGYQYLLKNKIDEKVLKNFSNFDASIQDEVRTALLQICRNNSYSLSSCKSGLKKAELRKRVDTFYSGYTAGATKNWNSFFTIDSLNKRRDVSWVRDQLYVPFLKTTEVLQKYLSSNIEDEFRFGTWKLLLRFSNVLIGPRLELKKGVTPHVSAVGGNVITIDENLPLEDNQSNWLIRHEFGHVLGLKDCYVEFYDEYAEEFVSYPLDDGDLMCSRAGRMNERIYKELRRVYGPKK